jgi:type IV pilus assembly protein PilW
MRAAQRASHASNGRARSGHRGFTLIELMIALLIGIFLLGALLTIVQTNRTVFGDQNKMAQLQDAERMALTMMSDVIQSAAYFPTPYNAPSGVIGNTLTGSLPSIAAPVVFAAPGQGVYGQSAVGGVGGAAGDSISIRYMTAPNDNIVNCSGGDNATAGNQTYINQFVVNNGALQCNLYVGAAAVQTYTLVGDGTTIVVNNLQILYGVSTSGAANSVDTYMTANQVDAAGQWGNVLSVMIQLTFNNPMYVAGQGLPQYITISRVVAVMTNSGPIPQ